jgi:flavin reductase (DIM6/NTAB) family NADH-FMN oxidoreductase RutF
MEVLMSRREVDFADVIQALHSQMDVPGGGKGVLLTSCDAAGRPNVMTIGWALYGPHYHGHNMAVVAVRPACHTFKLLDEVGEFVLCVPTNDIADAVAFCGRESGRTCDKFRETKLTPVASTLVKPPSIAECPIHVECRIYHKQRPPHFILTPEHRQAPVQAQHTIYFAEVLGSFALRD